jgi:cyanophycin synthetase
MHHAMAPLAELIRLLSRHIDQAADGPVLAATAQEILRHFAELRIGRYRASLQAAAYRDGIVFQQLSNQAFQFGIGRHSVLMDSTISEHTSSIGVRLARRKTHAAAALRRMGLPVPDHRLASGEEEAVRIAAQLSYPVVVKPADLDGGEGVFPDLRNEAEVRRAFAAARELSAQILIEKHVPGNDYRLMMFRGRLVWACIKEPAGVTGDGRLSISQLVEQANLDPERGDGVNTPHRRLEIDGEAAELLVRDGLSAQAVPDAGRFVRLRRAGNVALGGRAIDLAGDIHPDNVRLAAMAADVLRLDLAGVDLLLPDISRSWLETGGAICEVNAQPQIGGKDPLPVYSLILAELLGGDGNVPVVATLGGERAQAMARKIAADFSGRGLVVGLQNDDGVFLSAEMLLAGPASLMRGVRLLSSRRELDMLVFAIGDGEIAATGLPLPRIDTLVLSGEPLAPTDQQSGTSPEIFMTRLLEMIAPSCARILLAGSFGESEPDLRAALDRLGCPIELVDEPDVVSMGKG